MKRMQSLTLCLVLALTTTACLRTRAQIKDDGSDSDQEASQPVAVKVHEVQSQGNAVDEIKTEMTRLNGRIEELERAQSQAQASTQATQAARDETKKLESRIQELENAQAQMLEAIQKIRTAPAAAADTPEAYDRARAQFNSGDFAGAVESLSSYLRNPKAAHFQEATFLRGEAYFHLKQYKKAIVDYSKFPERYQGSYHTPGALYKIGLSFEGLGMKDDAKSFYQDLAEKFPKSAEGKKAKAKLK